MKKLLTLILVLCSIVGFAQMRGGAQYDPGAARTNLSNVDAAATPSMASITLSDKVRAAWADILGDIYASGTVKVSTGTAAAPAYSFASDPNTGMYSPAADNLGVSVGGVQVATFAATGLGLTSPLTISNGGTGKTTAAEALAALGGASLNGSSTVAFNASTINGVAPLTLVEKGYLVATGTILGAPTNSVTVNIASLTGNITGVYRVIAHSTTAENAGDDFVEILAVRKNHVSTSYTTRSHVVAQYESSGDNSQIVVATATSQITFNVSNTSNLHYRIQLKKVGEAYKNGANPE